MPTEVYVHDGRHSFISWMLHGVLRIAGALTNPLGNALDKSEFQSEPASMPKSFATKYEVTEETFDGRTLWTIAPKGGRSDRVIFYIHGGAYVFNVIGLHWSFIAHFVDETQATVVVVDYPLTPATSASEVFPYMDAAYRETLNRHEGKEILFMGDSSGGGLSIAFAQHLRNEGTPQPSQIIVLSPWLDVGLNNPDIDPKDEPAMRIEELQRAGRMYAGDLSTDDWRVSPIYGDFDGVASIAVFVGTHELFIADNRKLKRQMDEAGIPFRYFEYPKMLHTWALFNMPESTAARAQMVELILR